MQSLCPLYPRKRTCAAHKPMSAFDPKRTFTHGTARRRIDFFLRPFLKQTWFYEKDFFFSCAFWTANLCGVNVGS